MKILLVFLLLSQSGSATQSPFDGTWVIDSDSTQLPQKAAVYLLAKGMFDWSGTQIKADGHDQKVPESGYWDTVSVRIVDDRTVEIISKKAGKTMFTEVDTVSADGQTLNQVRCRPSQSRLLANDSKRGLTGPICYPAPGKPTK